VSSAVDYIGDLSDPRYGNIEILRIILIPHMVIVYYFSD
jgi:hypothetical protein